MYCESFERNRVQLGDQPPHGGHLQFGAWTTPFPSHSIHASKRTPARGLLAERRADVQPAFAQLDMENSQCFSTCRPIKMAPHQPQEIKQLIGRSYKRTLIASFVRSLPSLQVPPWHSPWQTISPHFHREFTACRTRDLV